MTTVQDNMEKRIWDALEQVTDPEIPVLTVNDLGIIRSVQYHPGTETNKGTAVIVITPTYTGCPAMDVIRMQIRMVLLEQGFEKVEIKTVLSPAWTTDWMTESGKQKLEAYGIAPPHQSRQVTAGMFEEVTVACPRCHSNDTRRISEFGATSCKALYQCNNCQEPFDYFKCH